MEKKEKEKRVRPPKKVRDQQKKQMESFEEKVERVHRTIENCITNGPPVLASVASSSDTPFKELSMCCVQGIMWPTSVRARLSRPITLSREALLA